MTAPAAVLSSRRERLAAAPIYLVATFPLPDIGETLGRVAAAAAALQADAGAVAVQLRLKEAATEARRALLARARSELPSGTLLLVNDDLEAVFGPTGELLADGVHLGREDAAALSPRGVDATARTAAGLATARARLGRELLLGTSTRTLAELRTVLAAGADHAGFGAIAASVTKQDTRPAHLVELVRCLEEFPRVPIFPLGGLTPENLGRVAAAGARRAAVGAGILGARDPAAAARACLRALRAAG
ncbi:MAG TPA: thiamine phosphate synthase [Planctomycetota bacterium]|nr:thiamine phosphate synthase [Planctomycetota bacterium]